MTKTEALSTLANCEQVFIRRIRSAIADYAQYGLTMARLENAIKKHDWARARTEVLKSLAGCPGCDLAIVNPDGDLARNLRYILRYCELLVKNRELTEKVNAISTT